MLTSPFDNVEPRGSVPVPSRFGNPKRATPFSMRNLHPRNEHAARRRASSMSRRGVIQAQPRQLLPPALPRLLGVDHLRPRRSVIRRPHLHLRASQLRLESLPQLRPPRHPRKPYPAHPARRGARNQLSSRMEWSRPRKSNASGQRSAMRATCARRFPAPAPRMDSALTSAEAIGSPAWVWENLASTWGALTLPWLPRLRMTLPPSCWIVTIASICVGRCVPACPSPAARALTSYRPRTHRWTASAALSNASALHPSPVHRSSRRGSIAS